MFKLYNMKFLINVLCLALSALSLQAQNEYLQINNTLGQFISALEQGDSSAISPLLSPNCTLKSFTAKTSQSQTASEFLKALASKPKNQKWEERLTGLEIRVDSFMASVWTPYEFFLDGKFSHCGANVFILAKQNGQWKIQSISDSRKPENCIATKMLQTKLTLETLLTNWHKAAAEANFEAYFDPMSEASIYLGTDASERWTKAEFKAFSKPFFDKGKAWNFKALQRNITIDNNGNIAWFDEKLDTWMGTCRGSGVLKLENSGEWKIIQYNLTMTIPNEKTSEVLKVLGVEAKK